MQIHLKQLEIEAALRQFISQQGISLVGKTVGIAFTSGRKDNGLSAEVTIEDVALNTDRRIAGKVTPEETKPASESGTFVSATGSTQGAEATTVKTTSLFT